MATSTRPARGAKATPAAATKATPPKAASTTTEASKPEVIELIAAEPTKNYAKFVADPSTGIKGSLYVPLGTASVRVAVYAE